MISIIPEAREGRKYQVHHSVKICHINCKDLNNRLGSKESKGSSKCGLQDVEKRFVRSLIFSMKGIIAGFFSQPVRFSFKKLWGIRFLEKENAETLNNGCKYRYCIK